MHMRQGGIDGATRERVRAAALLLTMVLALTACGDGASAAPSANPANLAPAPDYAGHPTINGIPCETTERVTYHVHAHLAVFVDGQPKMVPYGIGIAAPRQVQNSTEGPFVGAGACFYWLHTHTEDGIIHVEAPVPMDFTLGQFFDVWQQPLSDTQAGPAKGTVLAYLNGQRYLGDVRQMSLAAHNLIQLNVGQDVPPQPFTFPSGL